MKMIQIALKKVMWSNKKTQNETKSLLASSLHTGEAHACIYGAILQQPNSAIKVGLIRNKTFDMINHL